MPRPLLARDLSWDRGAVDEDLDESPLSRFLILRLEMEADSTNLVRVTRSAKSAVRKRSKRSVHAGHWIFQDAKARLSELVRRARSEGPQHVTVRGRDGVVVMAEEAFRRLKGERTGAALVAAMQASPFREIELQPKRMPMPVRNVGLG